MISSISKLRSNPQQFIFGSTLIISIILLVIGTAASYPISEVGLEKSVLDKIHIEFWVGFTGSLLSLVILGYSSKSFSLQFLFCLLFVLLLSSPQFLFISWGSDAGSLAQLVDLSIKETHFLPSGMFEINSYFQWPSSIFFHKLIGDMFNVDPYAASRIGLIITSISVASGLFLLLNDPFSEETTENSRSGSFFAIALYFISTFWLSNWQAVPFTFSLGILLPILFLITRKELNSRILLLLFLIVGLETHVLIGIWILMILIAWWLVSKLRDSSFRFTQTSLSLIVLVAILQGALIVYKNIRFFEGILNSLQGFYNELYAIGTTDTVLVHHSSAALNLLPSDMISAVLKSLGWINLLFAMLAFAIATYTYLRSQKLPSKEFSFLLTALGYAALGTVIVAIGIRSIHLFALPFAYMLNKQFWKEGKLVRLLQFSSVIAIILFPATMMRSVQQNLNYVSSADRLFSEYSRSTLKSWPKQSVLITEHIRPLRSEDMPLIISPRKLTYRSELPACDGPLFLAYNEMLIGDAGIQEILSRYSTTEIFGNTVLYDSGNLKFMFLGNCE